MQLILMHKILMGTAIFGGTAYCAWSVFSYTQSGATSALIMGLVSAAATAAIGIYLRNFARKHAEKLSR